MRKNTIYMRKNTLTIIMLLTIALPTVLAHAIQTDYVAIKGSGNDSAKQLNDSCFIAEDICDSVFQLMRGKSYKTGGLISRGELRYLRLLHYTADGTVQHGELVCHKDIAADLIDIFKKLYEAHYPIERMKLIDNYDADDTRSMAANNTSCFNYRHIEGSRSLSNHSKGRAIDINPLYNPCVKTHGGRLVVNPPSAVPYVNRHKKSTPYRMIDREDLCCKLFKAHGFRWGGDWRTLKDYQHFEK